MNQPHYPQVLVLSHNTAIKSHKTPPLNLKNHDEITTYLAKSQSDQRNPYLNPYKSLLLLNPIISHYIDGLIIPLYDNPYYNPCKSILLAHHTIHQRKCF